MTAADQATDTPNASELALNATPALDATLAATLRAASEAAGIHSPGAPLDIAEHNAGTQTLLRGLAIIEAAAANTHDMRAFATMLGTTRSTTYRLVNALVQARYLRQTSSGYLLGPKLIELGTLALEQMPLTTVARPYLDRLAQATLDTVNLGVRDGRDVLFIDKISSQRGLELGSDVGRRMPLASTGIGKALMIDLRPQEWAALFQASRCGLSSARFKSESRPDKPVFLHGMVRYVAGGFAFDLGENEESIRCVAAPVRDASGAIVAAVSVASAIPFMPLERMEELVPIVQREARGISEELGWQAPQSTRRIRR
jgi:DNA-binding IclR family transcriptional regulator